jgi:transcriptional regulator with XRE-family HTH domain
MRRMTMAQVAAAVGISETYVSLVEAGQRVPSVPVARLWSQAVGLDDATTTLFEAAGSVRVGGRR